MTTGDTIVAISSAAGPAARMIVRLSGPDAGSILKNLIHRADGGKSGASPSQAMTPGAPAIAQRVQLAICGESMPAWAMFFSEGKSYTGEALVELHIPGNPLVARLLVEGAMRAGARAAEAGEFTARAYLSGRLNLVGAEGIAAAIAAHSADELEAARQLRSGTLARRLEPLMNELAELLALIEAGIDFSEEDISFLSAPEMRRRIVAVVESLRELSAGGERYERLAHEPTFVLVGYPNAGKSTLLNALAGRDRAIVSNEAGTTRDALMAEVALERGMIRLIDVAGIDEAADDSVDVSNDSPPTALRQISRAMRRRALEYARDADFVIAVREINDSRPAPETGRAAALRLAAKIDQAPTANGGGLQPGEIAISALNDAGMVVLRARLDELAFGAPAAAHRVILNQRHRSSIGEAADALDRAFESCDVDAGQEIIADDVRRALDALGTVLGQKSPDELLGRVFAKFCIGK